LYSEENDALVNALISDELFFGMLMLPVLIVLGIGFGIVIFLSGVLCFACSAALNQEVKEVTVYGKPP